jgi:hypothetical protein
MGRFTKDPTARKYLRKKNMTICEFHGALLISILVLVLELVLVLD